MWETLDALMATFADQGTLFWTAAAAAALGASMLAAAGLVQLRRWRGRRPAAVKAAPVARATDHGYEPARPAAAAAPPKVDRELLARLRAAADVLEQLRDGRDLTQSSLKPTGPDVDYVFKAGVG